MLAPHLLSHPFTEERAFSAASYMVPTSKPARTNSSTLIQEKDKASETQ